MQILFAYKNLMEGKARCQRRILQCLPLHRSVNLTFSEYDNTVTRGKKTMCEITVPGSNSIIRYDTLKRVERTVIFSPSCLYLNLSQHRSERDRVYLGINREIWHNTALNLSIEPIRVKFSTGTTSYSQVDTYMLSF
jgi:hypothetical protein